MQIPAPVPWLSNMIRLLKAVALVKTMQRKLLLLKPDNYENFRAMDFHELSDED